jgi:hypothetical protein
MLEKEIELVNDVMESGRVWSHKRAAWYTIKEALETQLQNTSSNSDYAKCINCGKEFKVETSLCKECSDFGDGCGA